jgi:hypothetical protein
LEVWISELTLELSRSKVLKGSLRLRLILLPQSSPSKIPYFLPLLWT